MRGSGSESDDGGGLPGGIGDAIAALALVVGSPHPDGTIGFDGDIMIIAGGEPDEVGKRCAKGIGQDWRGKGVGGGVGGAVAEFAEVVQAPFPSGAVGFQGGGMTVAAGDGDDVADV